MIASFISAATFTPMSSTDQAKPRSSAAASTASRRARARRPVSRSTRSAMHGELALAARQRLAQGVQRLDNLGRLECFQARGVLEIDAAGKHLDRALGRFGLELGRRVAGEDDRR